MNANQKKTKVTKLLALIFTLIMFLAPASREVQAANSQSFSDVPGSHWAYSYIMGLNEMGIINGYRNGRFGSGDPISRAQASTMIIKGADIGISSKKANFTDVSRKNEFSSFIAALVDYDAVNGYRDGRFGPNDKITRGQIAAIVVRAFNLKPGTQRVSFSDTSKSEFRGYINTLASNGIVNGYEDGRYGPGIPVTRAEFSVIISKSMRVSGKKVILTPRPSGSTQPSPTEGRIKGNISSKGEKIYHVPGGAYYNRTDIDPSRGERWFRTEAEAIAAGWRKSSR